jgi:hypothetical protein
MNKPGIWWKPIDKRDLDAVSALLAGGMNVNEWYKGYTPLGRAIRTNFVPMVELLLKHKADIELACWKTLPPLLYSVVRQFFPCLLTREVHRYGRACFRLTTQN